MDGINLGKGLSLLTALFKFEHMFKAEVFINTILDLHDSKHFKMLWNEDFYGGGRLWFSFRMETLLRLLNCSLSKTDFILFIV